jgi:hypothetical protein
MNSLVMNNQDYLLVVVYNAKESRLHGIRKWLLGVPIFFGSIFGFTSIPYISNGSFGCHLTPPNPLFPTEVLKQLGYQDSNWQIISLLLVPAFLAIFYSTVVNSFMLFKMWRVDKKSQKWTFSQKSIALHSKKGRVKLQVTALTKLRREVFQQCFQYLAAVYLTWSLYLIVTVKIDLFFTSNYGLWALVFFLTGFQGFLNCMIYFQPRIFRYARHLRKVWRDRQLMKKKHTTPDLVEIADENKMNRIHTWNQIAHVEPAVDIITAFEDKTEPIFQEKTKEENDDAKSSSEHVVDGKQITEVQSCKVITFLDPVLQNNNEYSLESCNIQPCQSKQTPLC